MPQDRRTQLKPHSRLRLKELARIQARRVQTLESDPQYVVERDKLISKLEEEYARNPKRVSAFFRQFRWPIAPKLEALQSFLSRVKKDKKLREILSRYVIFANRFRVAFVLRTKAPHFNPIVLLPGGAKFHVKVKKGQLTPVRSISDEESIDTSFESSFESREVSFSDPLRLAIGSLEGNFVLIDDNEGSSLLSILEAVAYFPEGMTFVLHRAEQPYLLCLVGRKISDDLWRKAYKTVSAFLREELAGGKAGRPKDLQKWNRANRLLKTPGSLKEKAVELAGNAPNVPTQQSYLSRILKERRK
jgi:hypothetical protein